MGRLFQESGFKGFAVDCKVAFGTSILGFIAVLFETKFADRFLEDCFKEQMVRVVGFEEVLDGIM